MVDYDDKTKAEIRLAVIREYAAALEDARSFIMDNSERNDGTTKNRYVKASRAISAVLQNVQYYGD